MTPFSASIIPQVSSETGSRNNSVKVLNVLQTDLFHVCCPKLNSSSLFTAQVQTCRGSGLTAPPRMRRRLVSEREELNIRWFDYFHEDFLVLGRFIFFTCVTKFYLKLQATKGINPRSPRRSDDG